MKHFHKILSVLILVLGLALAASAQTSDEIVNSSKTAMKAGSSKDLSRYFSDLVELSLLGEKSSYSKAHAEVLVKDFFKKYPPVDFQYIHQGSSKEGLKYAIGKYSYNGGSFRVYLLIKQFGGDYLIDTLEFSKE
ncbi:MAG: DUF4783 domain-containing protein [Cytophagaceae bacterium]